METSQNAQQSALAHVLNRVAYGPRRRDWQRAAELGAEEYIREQLVPEELSDDPAAGKLARLPSLSMDMAELYEEYPPPQIAERRMRQDEELDEEARRRLFAHSVQPLRELGAARVIRAAESNKQLNEVLVDFWYNHFNVFANSGQARYLVPTYERDAIRPHVLGSFHQMLRAVAYSPAMLVYLDNWRSAAEEDRDVAGSAPQPRNDAIEDAIRRMQRSGRMDPRRTQQQMQQIRRRQQAARSNRPPGLNENYARELMELHTLGVDGGYTQQDIVEVARAFTGWTLTLGGRDGPGFVFRADWHDAEPKSVLGHDLPAGRGLEDGEEVLALLARHPSTATFIATKLCRKFVADDPPGDLVDRVAGEFLRTGGNLRATTAAVLLSPEFLGTEYRGAKVKSPLEFLVSTARALEAPIGTEGQLGRALRLLGAPLYGASPPTGYPDTAEEWTSANAILARMEVGGRLAGVVFGGRPLGGPPGVGGGGRGGSGAGNRRQERGPRGSIEERTNALIAQILPGGVGDDTRNKITAWGAAQDETPGNAEIATLILGSPEFQRR